MIPKIIWQTHELQRSKLPNFIQQISDTWINLNPNYKYVYMNSEERREYIKNKCPELLKFYDIIPQKQQQFNWHFPAGVYQADIWRYVVTYNEGGFYADMDSVCISSLDNILNFKYKSEDTIAFGPKCTNHLVSKLYKNIPTNSKMNFKQGKKSLNNSNFGCVKNSLVMKNVIDVIDLKNNSKIDDEKHNPEWTMGPSIFSDILLNNYNKVLFIDEQTPEHNREYQFGLHRLENPKNLNVNYLGTEMTYFDVLKLKNK